MSTDTNMAMVRNFWGYIWEI